MKQCKICKTNKEFSEFPIEKKKRSTGEYYTRYMARCRLCYNTYLRMYAKEHPTQHRKKTKRVRDKRKLMLSELKLEIGCVICSYNKHAGALHWHHIDPTSKEFQISDHPTLSIQRIEQEIKKCILLCSNCHSEIEAGITDIEPYLKYNENIQSLSLTTQSYILP